MVIGKKTFEFTVELCGQCFVVRHNERGFSRLFDHFCHRVSLPAACDTQKGLIPIAFQDRIADCFDGLGLVTGGVVRAAHRKIWHVNTPFIQYFNFIFYLFGYYNKKIAEGAAEFCFASLLQF